jgi:serine/threonine protein phosphatase PrpC
MLKEDEMRFHHLKNILTASVMGDLKDDIPKSYIKEILLKDTQYFLLCTDGVWGAISLEEIEEGFIHEDIRQEARALHEKITEGDAEDKFSFIIAKVK